MSKAQHWSDCAIYNAPALEPGECDCGGYPCEGTLLHALQDVNEAFVALWNELVKLSTADLERLRRLLP